MGCSNQLLVRPRTHSMTDRSIKKSRKLTDGQVTHHCIPFGHCTRLLSLFKLSLESTHSQRVYHEVLLGTLMSRVVV
jgi:hypothetical protein